MNKLIYINGIGPNYKGDNLYEFIFSDILEVWSDKSIIGFVIESEKTLILFSSK